MKPKPQTIQFLLPTASPGEIELVYREIMNLVGANDPLSKDESDSDYFYSYGYNSAKTEFKQKLNELFGKEG